MRGPAARRRPCPPRYSTSRRRVVTAATATSSTAQGGRHKAPLDRVAASVAPGTVGSIGPRELGCPRRRARPSPHREEAARSRPWHSQAPATMRRIGSTNCVNASTMTIAAIWLVKSAPRPSPEKRPQRRRRGRCAASNRARQARRAAVSRRSPQARRRPRQPSRRGRSRRRERLTTVPTTAFAARTTPRRGWARNVGVSVRRRYSLVASSAPNSSGMTRPTVVVEL